MSHQTYTCSECSSNTVSVDLDASEFASIAASGAPIEVTCGSCGESLFICACASCIRKSQTWACLEDYDNHRNGTISVEGVLTPSSSRLADSSMTPRLAQYMPPSEESDESWIEPRVISIESSPDREGLSIHPDDLFDLNVDDTLALEPRLTDDGKEDDAEQEEDRVKEEAVVAKRMSI